MLTGAGLIQSWSGGDASHEVTETEHICMTNQNASNRCKHRRRMRCLVAFFFSLRHSRHLDNYDSLWVKPLEGFKVSLQETALFVHEIAL